MHRETAPSAPAADLAHRPQLDGLRFFAFLGVFIFHANPNRFTAGSLGVQLFFVLSGFLITRILLKNRGASLADDLRVFYIRRALRIFPLYYATLIVVQLAGLASHPASSWLHLYNFDCYFSRRFLGHTPHLWTLAVEEQFYLVYPLLLLATPARWRLRLLWALLGTCALSRLLLDRFAPSTFTGILPIVSGEHLIAGAIAGYWDCARPDGRPSATRFLGSALIAIWAALWLNRFPVGPSWLDPFAVIPHVVAGAFALFVWEVWKSRGLVSRFLGLKPLAYLGKISYGCYLFHVFVLSQNGRLIEALRSVGLPTFEGLKSLPALVATIVLSMLSWHLFESPILALKSRFRYGRPKADSPRPAIDLRTAPAAPRPPDRAAIGPHAVASG